MKFSFYSTKKSALFSKRALMHICFSVLVIIVFIYNQTKTAQASLFSFWSGVLGGSQVSAQITSVNHGPTSQNMPLLRAATNHNPTPDFIPENIPVLRGETLVPDLALSNELAGSDGEINTQISLYVVRPGDTLSDIARMFDVSVNTIVWANNISKSSPLQTNQTLVILPVTGITHTVKKGDTIQSIATKYKADIREVLQYNDINVSSVLIAGQSIIIPDVEMAGSPVLGSSKGTVSKNTKVWGTSGPTYSGYYIRPIVGGRKTQGLHGNNGVDLADRADANIFASAEGTVIVSMSDGGWHGGYGNFIIISHPNGTQTVYAHLSRNNVRSGEYVQQGQVIGFMGSTGHSTGPHLHFEIRGAKNPF